MRVHIDMRAFGNWFFILLLGVMLLPAPGAAQVSAVSTTLVGGVTDSAGAVIPGAQLTVRNVETGQTRRATSNQQGEFWITELPAGTYEITAAHAGFADYHHAGITLLMGKAVRLAIILQPATVEKEITVTSQPDALQPTETTLITNVETERIAELPVQNRNYLNFVLLSPGVSNSQTPPQPSGGQAGLGLTDSGFSFGGLRGRSNSISIDGLDNNDEFTGASRTELSLEIVREFQVVNTGISAESGGASGGAIDVITRSGTNIIHGDAFLFVQNAATSARDPLSDAGERPEFNRYRAGLALGGPVRKNRTFYYIASEQEHTRTQEASDIDASARDTINATLASGAWPGLSTRNLASGLFGTARAETELSGKLDHQLTDRQTLMLRYAFTNNREAGDGFNTNSVADFSARGSAFAKDHALVGSLTSAFSPQFLNSLRFQIARREVVLRSTDPVGPGVEISGIANFGRPYSGNSARRETHYVIADTASQARGSHLIKFGATVNRVALDAAVQDGFGGQYIFPTVADFVAGRPQQWRQTFGHAETNFAVTSYGFFLQDHWSPRWARCLTVDLGLRYDYEQLPPRFSQDYNNVSPRLGLAFSPGDKWVLRAAYGIYFDRYLLAFLNPAEQRDGQRALEQVLNGSTAAALFAMSGGASLATPVLGPRPSIYQADARLSTPYSQQLSTGIERLLTRNTTLGATYEFVRGVKLPRTVNVNLAPPVLLSGAKAESFGIVNPTAQQIGRLVFGSGRLQPDYDGIYQLQDRAGSTYHGVSIALNHRLANEVAFSSSYTLSRTMDDASDFNEQPQNPYDLHAERSVSRNDQHHRFVFSGLFDLPFGDEEDRRSGAPEKKTALKSILGNIEFAPILTVGSGVPVNPIVGFDANQSGAFPLSSRPLGYARNSLRTPALVNLDLRLVKYVNVKPHGRLDFVAELFNAFNRANVTAINNVFGLGTTPNAGFGQPIELLRPRQAQFSIDFEF